MKKSELLGYLITAAVGLAIYCVSRGTPFVLEGLLIYLFFYIKVIRNRVDSVKLTQIEGRAFRKETVEKRHEIDTLMLKADTARAIGAVPQEKMYLDQAGEALEELVELVKIEEADLANLIKKRDDLESRS